MTLEDILQSLPAQEGIYPICDSTIKFETVPIFAAVKEIADAKMEYRKETDCVRELNSTTNNENTLPWDNTTYVDKWITKKEIVVFGWEIGDYLENAWNIYHHPNDSREKYYRLGCLDISGKLIIDFKYCIIEVIGNYIFAGYDGDYIHNTFHGLYDLYTVDGDYLFGGFTSYHFYREESILACNWCGNWNNVSNGSSSKYEFDPQSGYWSLFDLSTEKIQLNNGNVFESQYWNRTGDIKSLLPLRDGRDFGIPLMTQVLSYEMTVCGKKRKMPNLPIETLFIMGNHTNKDYPCIEKTFIHPELVSSPESEYDNRSSQKQNNCSNYENGNIHLVLFDIHLFTSNTSYLHNGEKHLFTSDCMDYSLNEKKPIKNEEYKAEDIRRKSYSNKYRRCAGDNYIRPFDNPYYNDALDMDQQSPGFWENL